MPELRCAVVAGILICAKDPGHDGVHYDPELGLSWQTRTERALADSIMKGTPK